MHRRVHHRPLKAVTLRQLSPELSDVLRRRASETGRSMNKTIQLVLEETLLPLESPPPRRVYRDLDWMFGSWTKEEADEFDRNLAEQRKIDPEMWK